MMQDETQREIDRIKAIYPVDKPDLESDVARWQATLERLKATDPVEVKADWLAVLETTDPKLFKVDRITKADEIAKVKFRDPDDFKTEQIAKFELVVRGVAMDFFRNSLSRRIADD